MTGHDMGKCRGDKWRLSFTSTDLNHWILAILSKIELVKAINSNVDLTSSISTAKISFNFDYDISKPNYFFRYFNLQVYAKFNESTKIRKLQHVS